MLQLHPTGAELSECPVALGGRKIALGMLRTGASDLAAVGDSGKDAAASSGSRAVRC